MPANSVLHIRQDASVNGAYPIRLTLRRTGKPDIEANANIEFALTPQERSDLRWYLEDYLQHAESTTGDHILQVESMLRNRGIELYEKILEGSRDVQRIFDRILDEIANLRIEISSGIVEAASIPWELMREPYSDSPIAVRVKAFVRVQSTPSLNFVQVPPSEDGRIRLLYIVCRPNGIHDVELRAIINRLLQGLGSDLGVFDITALRPPTYEHLQRVLTDAKHAGKPFHIVHFDGHGIYEDLSETALADLGHIATRKHGYLLFEHPGSDAKMRPVPGEQLGKLLHDTEVPVLVLNACQSAMHQEIEQQPSHDSVHDEVRAIGSFAQAVVDQGIPAVLGMRYSVYVVTAAQYIGELYRSLAKGLGFGEAATEGRRHLYANPERWVGLNPRPLQDWIVPVVYEALPLQILSVGEASNAGLISRDPVQNDLTLLRYVPDTGFIGRDETLLLLDRAFDSHPVVLLHAYAGQGKTTTAVEFSRWYALTGGLGPTPLVFLTSFESQRDMTDLLNQIGQVVIDDWSSINLLAEKRKRVIQFFRQVPVLWIWDNVEPVAGFPDGNESQWTQDEQRELSEFLKLLKLDPASQAKILLTSRRDEQKWLGGVPYRVKMPRMKSSDAARLAVSLGAERHHTPAEIAAWQPLIDYCAGNPLTLRVIAAQAMRLGLRGEPQVAAFVQAIRDGEVEIEDAEDYQGHDKSLGASLDYGFRHTFNDAELLVIALLHLFQETVNSQVLRAMGAWDTDFAVPELKGRTQEWLDSLLKRCGEIGILTPLGENLYSVHPALPWFLRQLFIRCYSKELDRSTTICRSWVEAIGELSRVYHEHFINGNRSVIRLLKREEANLLQARRLASHNGWWLRVFSVMQGLHVLYEYEGRSAQWSKLVAEIIPDFCTVDDQPLPGTEAVYSGVMSYRVKLHLRHERDLNKAQYLQEKVVAWDRERAAVALTHPSDATLDNVQKNRIRSLAVSLSTLGQIRFEQGDCECVAAFEESVAHNQRIHDASGESIAHFHLGHAYMQLPAICNWESAEASYQKSLSLVQEGDVRVRTACLKQIGMLHQKRFVTARRASASEEALLKHALAAESYYLQALEICSPGDINNLGPLHSVLGTFYLEVGQTDLALVHFGQAMQVFEKSGDYYRAGGVRFNISQVYLRSSAHEESPEIARDLVLRARSYAEAALRDFQHFQGRADADEDKTRRMLKEIESVLDEVQG